MFGVKLMSASKFPSSMNAASKPTMEPLISALSNVWFKPIKQDSESTIAFLKYLLSQCRESQIALLWMEPVIIVPMRLGLILNRSIKDSNLRSGKNYLFASLPMHPEQNPIENIWLRKTVGGECYHLCQNFSTVSFLFEFVTHQTFDFPSFILMAVSHNSFRIAIVFLFSIASYKIHSAANWESASIMVFTYTNHLLLVK